MLSCIFDRFKLFNELTKQILTLITTLDKIFIIYLGYYVVGI